MYLIRNLSEICSLGATNNSSKLHTDRTIQNQYVFKPEANERELFQTILKKK
jgi:hypothetical protein